MYIFIYTFFLSRYCCCSHCCCWLASPMFLFICLIYLFFRHHICANISINWLSISSAWCGDEYFDSNSPLFWWHILNQTVTTCSQHTNSIFITQTTWFFPCLFFTVQNHIVFACLHSIEDLEFFWVSSKRFPLYLFVPLLSFYFFSVKIKFSPNFWPFDLFQFFPLKFPYFQFHLFDFKFLFRFFLSFLFSLSSIPLFPSFILHNFVPLNENILLS